MARASFYGSALKLNTTTRHSQAFQTRLGSFICATVVHLLYNYASKNHMKSCMTGTETPEPPGDCLALVLRLVSSQDTVCLMVASLMQITGDILVPVCL